MFYLIGLFIATASLVASVVHLGQSASSYYDFVGFMMVLGGTLAAAAITFPWEIKGEIVRRSLELFHRSSLDRRELLNACMQVNENVARGSFKFETRETQLPYRILRDGVELLQLGFSADKIEPILKERLYQAVERGRLVGTSLRSLSKYPPAFGLAGTVLGLVHLMRGISTGMSPQETGVRMAIALIATFYGLLVANLIVNPAGEAMCNNANNDQKMGEIALQAILLAADKANLLEAQEMLNSFVEENHRVDTVGVHNEAPEPVVEAA